ncbi:MAG: sugar lyase [Bacteroidales bacterium]|nr:sugar lyase [Bacteroidales bacterium]
MRKVSVILLSLLVCVHLAAQVDFAHPDYMSFECGRGSSTEHYKTGAHSLKWSWKRPNAVLNLNRPVPYLKNNPNPEETSVSSFVFWVYSPEELAGELRFEFLKKGRVCCWFPYKLGFQGWRGAWVAFDRDMQGTPEEGMDRIRIRVNGPRKGSLYFDGIIPAVFEDVRYHTADFQAPFINPDTDIHWLQLLSHSRKELDIPVKTVLQENDKAAMDTLLTRFISLVSDGKKGLVLDEARRIHASYDIQYNSDGTVVGKPVFFTRYGETYLNLGISDASRRFGAEGQLLRTYNDHMFRIALSWKQATSPSVKEELASMYVDMTRHLLDQGFAAGSAQGTLHHLGYSMRNFYTAPVIMKDVLREAGLLKQVQEAMEWFSGVGEVKTAPEQPGMDIDAFNTYLLSRVAALIMMEDTPYKYACFQALSRWIDNGYKYTSGTKACFKTDGTVFHHRKAYPAYAVGGFDGAVKAVWLFHGTPFAVSEASHSNLKKALLEMRFYCNLASFPLAMSGRHPDGKGALIPEQYGLLALSGTPDASALIDGELAAAYLRLDPCGVWSRQLLEAGFRAEPPPQGVRSYAYNCSMSARKDHWLITFAGHSRYLWSAEIYRGANHYGRYLTHGSMEIIADGNPISAAGSGYQVDGYDWCHVPGTTAGVVPLQQMKAHVINPDKYSGYEEMLLSDEWFAGAVASGNFGVYAMKLHGNDKYDGSLRARKSFFFIDGTTVCLGSDIEGALPTHTTLFQNALDAPADYADTVSSCVLRDRFGNAWILEEGEAVFTRSLQHSFHEETDAPTEGWFEKAWISHEDRPTYEYMVLVHPSEKEIASYINAKPYSLISRSRALHAVKDTKTGLVAAAVFEESRVDELVEKASPCLLLYKKNGKHLELNVSNPDLALYDGEADEVYGPDGFTVERSVYSRRWVDNDCGATSITLQLAGDWKLEYAPEGTQVAVSGGSTTIILPTGEGRTETLVLL